MPLHYIQQLMEIHYTYDELFNKIKATQTDKDGKLVILICI